MKDLVLVYPEYAIIEKERGYFYGPGDYGLLIDSMGYETHIRVDDNDYQGDSRYILQGIGDRYGILIFGWGSCSGCDALQACEHMSEIEELRKYLNDKIIWGTAQQTLFYLESHDWEGDYGWHQEETKKFVRESIEYFKDILNQ